MYSTHCPQSTRVVKQLVSHPLINPTDLFRSGSHLERTLRSPITLQKSKYFKTRRRGTKYAIQEKIDITTQKINQTSKNNHAQKRKRIPIIVRNNQEINRDACYRNQNHVSGGSGEPRKSVGRKSENADIARSERGSR